MLHLPIRYTEDLRIRTFGSSEERRESCAVVEMGLVTEDGKTLKFSALAVPFICNPLTSQPTCHSRESYDHLLGLKLADSADVEDALEVDVLFGSDFYWKLVTGRVVKGKSGPTAIHTRFGWVLSGPVKRQETSVNLNFISTHALKVETYPAERNLDDRLRCFWELESLGVMRDELPVHEKFVQQISFTGGRYSVALPWREDHPPLPDHFDLCRRRLFGLLKRLKQNPPLLKDYHSVVKRSACKQHCGGS